MKSPKQMRHLAVTSFAILALVSCSREPSNRYNDMVLNAQADALQAKIVLTDLRVGNLTNALELLEMQIDTSVIIINHSLTNLSGADREMALGALRSLKAYREAHPRKQEAVFQNAEKQDADTMIQARQNASHILNDLK